MGLIDMIEAAYDARPLRKYPVPEWAVAGDFERMIDRVMAVYKETPLVFERVPEWETSDTGEVGLWFKPSTVDELMQVNQKLPSGLLKEAWNAELVVLKGRSANGELAFSPVDSERLMKKGFSKVINRLAVKMLSAKKASTEDCSPEFFLYWKPTTAYEIELSEKELPGDAPGVRKNAQLVVLKALDADGRRVFKNSDAEALSKYGFSSVINRLAELMRQVPSPEEAEKN